MCKHASFNIYGFWNVYTYAGFNIYESQYISKNIYIKNHISDSLHVFSKYLVNTTESPLTILSYSESIRIGSHDPKFLVNSPKFPLTYLLSSRITNYRKSISTNESSITNESSPRLSKVGIPLSFDQVSQLLAKTPSSGNIEYPLQWKYGTPLQWKLWLTPSVEIGRVIREGGDPTSGN